MSDFFRALDQSLQIPGAIGAALADYEQGICLGTAGAHDGFDLVDAVSGKATALRAEIEAEAESTFDLDGGLQDILLTLGEEYHLLSPFRETQLFLYLRLDRGTSDLDTARLTVAHLTAPQVPFVGFGSSYDSETVH